jgi:L,D-transpeptidase ErfK/SrfK
VPQALDTGIVINVPQRMLFLMNEGQLVAAYPVAVGRPSWPTFIGPFTVVAHESDPVWDVPRSIQEELRRAGKPVLTRVPPGPTNPLGKFWLGLSQPNFGIHGTIAPQSIYRFETHGCIRLHPDDIADLWPRVDVGAAGLAIYEPILLRVVDAQVLMEVHPDVYKRVGDKEAAARDALHRAAVTDGVDWSVIRRVIGEHDGRPHRVDSAVRLP